jgi:cytochrome o ubiquinol oxidase operon protein cyoD
MKNRAEYRRELRSYIVGFTAAAVLTVAAFISVAWGGLSRPSILWIVGISAIVQIVVHFRFFLHIDLSKSKRDDLELILFSALIVILMAGGTLWILANQQMRMM